MTNTENPLKQRGAVDDAAALFIPPAQLSTDGELGGPVAAPVDTRLGVRSTKVSASPTDRDLLLLGARRTAEMAAIFMIGDGLLGIFQAERHMALWRSSIAPLDAVARPFGGGALKRRLYGAAQVATGLVLASACRPRDMEVREAEKAKSA